MEFLLINRCSVCILVAGQIGPKSNHPQIKSLYYYVFLFNLIICIVNCVVYLIPNQIIVLLCCLFNLIIYLVHNALDFTQILYFAGGVRIINKNNVFIN
jgi:hypothetical protein